MKSTYRCLAVDRESSSIKLRQMWDRSGSVSKRANHLIADHCQRRLARRQRGFVRFWGTSGGLLRPRRRDRRFQPNEDRWVDCRGGSFSTDFGVLYGGYESWVSARRKGVCAGFRYVSIVLRKDGGS